MQKYQNDFVGSNISALTTAIQQILTKLSTSPATTKHTIIHTMVTHIRGAHSACRTTIRNAKADIDAVCSKVSDMRDRVDIIRVQSLLETGANGTWDVVDVALQDAEKEMLLVMDKLTWWRLLWRVDEIGGIVGTAIDKTWCRELENQVR